MAITPTAATLIAAGVAAAGTGVSIYEANQGAEAARKAAVRPFQNDPKAPTGINAADELKKANMQAQTAGGSLLSDPAENARTGNQTGTVPGLGKSLLGS